MYNYECLQFNNTNWYLRRKKHHPFLQNINSTVIAHIITNKIKIYTPNFYHHKKDTYGIM